MQYTITDVPELEQKIWARLVGFTQESYLVGGAVRDILLGETPKDFDFATLARPEQIIELFSDYEHVDLVGESFGVVIVEGVEIATFRGDRYFGGGDKDVEITYVDTIEEDLSRRDLTINAIALSFRGEIVDPFKGRQDLNERYIRFVGDAETRILEDPNRILRAARFSARLGFELGYSAFEAITNNAELVDTVAPERIRVELLKVLSSTVKSEPFFNVLRLTNVLERILPELTLTHGHDGGNYHPETVWEHILWATDGISTRFPLVRLAALFHDQGKPLALIQNDGQNFVHHDAISGKIARRRLTALKFSSEEVDTVVGLVRVHMRNGRYDQKHIKAYRRTVKRFDDLGVEWRDFVRLRIADHNSNEGSEPLTLQDVRELVDPWVNPLETEIPVRVTQLAVSGGELIDFFELERGPVVGELHRHLLQWVLENGTANNVPDLLFEEAEYWLEEPHYV